MKTLEILGFSKDIRTNTNIVYAQISISEYISLVGEDFDRFSIQRRREKYGAYKRLRSDILQGAQLPSITLAINPAFVKDYIKLIEDKNIKDLKKALSTSDKIYILDGLQRTYIISDLIKDNHELQSGQKLLIEFWFESNIKHLIYRLIVLNAGQKPMSMRHQVELLFMTLKDELEREINGLEIFTEKDGARRNSSRKFHFDRLVTSYYSFITKTPEIKRENIVVQQLSEQDILETEEDKLGQVYEDFKYYLDVFCQLDDEIFRIYSNHVNSEVRKTKNWLDEENVMNSMFAAISIFSNNTKRKDRVSQSLNVLVTQLKNTRKGSDPLGIIDYDKIRKGFNPKKVNVGYATRKLLVNGFKEFFREEGELSFSDCWKLSAE